MSQFEVELCGERVTWWDGEYEGDCGLINGHDGDHFDGMSWYDEHGERREHGEDEALLFDFLDGPRIYEHAWGAPVRAMLTPPPRIDVRSGTWGRYGELVTYVLHNGGYRLRNSLPAVLLS